MKNSYTPASFFKTGLGAMAIFAAALIPSTGWSQLTLTGSSYSQNFNSIGSGLPTGWSVQTGATATALGTPTTAVLTNTIAWSSTTARYVNFASGNAPSTATDASTLQASNPDRALGVRQSGSFVDPGACFLLEIANTSSMTAFSMSYKIQSLDITSPRTTTWTAQYAIGASPTSFTTISTSPLLATTGGSTFTNTTFTATLPAGIENQAGPVYIRIIALTASTGTGSRATSAIDDFSLSWTNSTVTPCADPTGLAAGNITATGADLSWNPQGGNTFEYAVNTSSAAPTGTGTAITGTTVSTSTLTASTVYYLHVRTDCGSGNYSNWATISFTTSAAPCAAPTGLAATNITGSGADYSWNPQSGITGFEYIIDQTATAPTISGAPTTGTVASSAFLSQGSVYYLHVRTDCGGGNYSPWSTLSFTTICNTPTGLAAANVTANSADLSWNPQGGINGFEYVVNQTASAPTGTGTATTGTATSTSTLTPATVYYLHVRSTCGSGSYSTWATVSFTTSIATGIASYSSDLGLSLFPNPVENILKIKVNGSNATAQISIVDMTGKAVRSLSSANSLIEVNTADLNAGIYFVKYSSEAGSKVLKFIKN